MRHVDLPSSKMSPTVNYNNVIYAVAGEAAANVAGILYADLIKTKVLEPLGLKDAGLSHPVMARKSNYAMPYDAATYEDARNGVYEEGYIDEIPMADAPAGDIYMNIVDLAKWGRVILKEGELDGKQVLNKECIQETLKSHNILNFPQRRPGFAPTLGYGLGWSLDFYKGHACIQHGMYSSPLCPHKNNESNNLWRRLTQGSSFYVFVRWRQPWLQIIFSLLPRR